MRHWLLFFLFSTAYSLNLVVYLTLIGKSHLDFANSLITALAERGHNVDVIVALLGAVDIQGKVRHARNVTSFGFGENNPWTKAQHLNNPFDMVSNVDMSFFHKCTFELGKIGIESEIPLEFLKSRKYDAVLVSDYDHFGYIFAKAAGINKVMGYVPTSIVYGQSIRIGLPNPISLPTDSMESGVEDFSLWNKFRRLWPVGRFLFYEAPHVLESTNLLVKQHYGSDFPSVEELGKNADIIFTNAHDLTDIPRTITHKIKYIGGIGLKKPKPLTKEFDEFLASKPKGGVIISFGTQVPPQNFNHRVKEALLNSFKRFPDHIFIWKYTKQPGDEKLVENVTNVKLVEWLPQTDLLYDQRMVGFITHSGLNSMQEYTHAGVPVVTIPLFADQAHNSRSVARLGIGVYVDKLTLDEEILTKALEEILYNEKYRNQSRHLAALLHNHPENPKKLFVKWVEYAATYENLHRQYNLPEAGMSFFSYYCLDMISVVFICLLFLIFSTIKIVSVTTTKAKLE